MGERRCSAELTDRLKRRATCTTFPGALRA